MLLEAWVVDRGEGVAAGAGVVAFPLGDAVAAAAHVRGEGLADRVVANCEGGDGVALGDLGGALNVQPCLLQLDACRLGVGGRFDRPFGE